MKTTELVSLAEVSVRMKLPYKTVQSWYNRRHINSFPRAHHGTYLNRRDRRVQGLLFDYNKVVAWRERALANQSRNRAESYRDKLTEENNQLRQQLERLRNDVLQWEIANNRAFWNPVFSVLRDAVDRSH